MKKFCFLLVCLLGIPIARATGPKPFSVTLSDFNLAGELTNDQANFTLTVTARVDDPKGATIKLLSGPVALTEFASRAGWSIRPAEGGFRLVFDRRGTFSVRLGFAAAVRQQEGWRQVDFQVVPASLQPVSLTGVPPDTEINFQGAARPERAGDTVKSYLPADGHVRLAWKAARPEGEGKLFYAAEMLSQLSVSPGLMRQTALLDFKVMQGEMSRVVVQVLGEGEVTRVQGEHILAWDLEKGAGAAGRRLVVKFNQAQRDHFALQLQMQTTVGAFPQAVDVMQLRPENATRFAGYIRIVNDGAVRLEVLQAAGLSQVSPEQFPESDALRLTGNQRFAYRFSGADYRLRVQADQIVPEMTVSEIIAYRLGENDLALDSEIELDVREAPLRELVLRVPKSYAVARLNIAGLADYFLTEPEGQAEAELRLVFGQPVSGRQVLELRLERNKPLGESTWNLPRIEVIKAKSVRGQIALGADAGFRLTPQRVQGLTEIATAFFPRKVPGMQSAFRLSDPGWRAVVQVERLPQTIQADAFHLFSVGEGIAYGSSLINYVVSGAPISTFKVQLSSEYFNVEFTGKDIRNWQKTDDGYLVQLHTPVSGPYALLATYERPFRAQGDTLTFTGARPVDARSEQGHTLIVSAYQFQVKPEEVSAGLLSLEPGEVPPEYRLFFDAPILAAYRYISRPFNLKLALRPLAQGDSLSQIVDRAVLRTRISKEGQILTDVHYLVKSRGNPHFRVTLPSGTDLWSATVNGSAVVPIADAGANLIPLPQTGDPNAVISLDLKLAAKAHSPNRISVAAPAAGAPVMLAEWKLEPDAGRRLVYRSGSLRPVGVAQDVSGFSQIRRMWNGEQGLRAKVWVAAALVLLIAALLAWRWAGDERATRHGIARFGGAALGLVMLALAVVAFTQLFGLAASQKVYLPRDLTFLVPVEQVGVAPTVEVLNTPEQASASGLLGYLWPALLVVPAWLFAWVSQAPSRQAGWLAGWVLLAWAMLRLPNGATGFLLAMAAFLCLHILVPGLVRLFRWARTARVGAQPGPAPGGASAAVALWIGLLVLLSTGGTGCASSRALESMAPAGAVADAVIQDVSVQDQFVLATARIHWQAEKGERLPLLFAPAVMTGILYPSNSMKLEQSLGSGGSGNEPVTTGLRGQELIAQRHGEYEIEVKYQLHVDKRGGESGFTLPVHSGLVNRLKLTLLNSDMEVMSSKAVSIQRAQETTNTVVTLVLEPAQETWITWRPRGRDLKREKAIFYAEVSQLYVPQAGVIEGLHRVSVRPAQGELSELTLSVPANASITDVADLPDDFTHTNRACLVSLWRFDPDSRKLRVTLSSAQSRPFSFFVRSQFATGPLPVERSLGLLGLDGAADQIGLVGVGTGNEVQLDSAAGEQLSAINLEDFPGDLAAGFQSQFGGVTVRRAFRYANPAAMLLLKGSTVEPDVRVEAQDTVSLGEDRTVLAAEDSVEITRAGIFRLSFLMPAGFDVESISGSALSHWTELNTADGRVITLHLNGKTEGAQKFSISLAGPGVRGTNAWRVPQVALREATKQRGTLLIVPEQGLRLQAGVADGVMQLDPQKAGIKQKGVLAFRVMQMPHTLTLDVEQVDPWIQVTSLQQATVSEAQLTVAANLQYQIDNTGLKAFRLFVPTNAEAVHFEGEQVADFLPETGVITNGMQAWTIRLQRRVIGRYLLSTTFRVPLAEKTQQTSLRGVEAADVNLQRGFVTVQSGGRLGLRVDSTPAALQPTEWQSIPRALRQGLPGGTADFSYRVIEAAFQLPLTLERHEAAKLLPARVNGIHFNSVISDQGVMLTQVRLELLPGDKRLLSITLPKNARFWFAFANQNGVWPWREQERILIPMEQESHGGKAMTVEFLYSCQAGKAGSRALDLDLAAPKFDLPLENVSWRVALSDRWKIKQWSGSLQLESERNASLPAAGLDLQNYLQGEAAQQRERTRQAEELLATGNSALAKGKPQEARRAFQAAYGLSAHDAAFNEDARVQLHNIKLQEALIGLNVRQAGPGDQAGLAGKLRELREGKAISYTQQDAKDILDRNSADENAAYMRLAERLIQQQDAATTSPGALHPTVPEQNHVLVFQRGVVVDPWADLQIRLEGVQVGGAGWGYRVSLLAVSAALLLVFYWVGRRTMHLREGSI